jgi:hypothetical protein
VRLGRQAGPPTALLAEQEARHRRELAALEARLAPGAARRAAAETDHDALLARVAEMIRESETRQSRLLDTSLSDLGQKSEARRRYDLARISAGFSYLEGKTGQQVARTTELMGYVLEASQKR